MADRKSIAIFGELFDQLAKTPTDEIKKVAENMWYFSSAYDFCNEQLECNDSLIKLGLAKMSNNPEYPIDSDVKEVVLYKGDDY